MKEPLRIGIAGLGTVGGGLVRLLTDNEDLIAARCGRTDRAARRDRAV